jgi:hypothetical protein
MKRVSWPVSCALLLWVFALDAVAADPGKATAKEAQAAAAKWLAGLGEKGLVLVEEDTETGFAGRGIAGSKSTMFVLQKPGWYVNLGFSGVISADTPVKTMRKRFKYVALNRLPTPGLDVPGWEIKPRTPVSSFRDGVEILGYKNGKIHVRVRTSFFALSGRDPSVLVPADAPMPEGSYFQIRQKFPLDLTLHVPFAMAE